MAKFNIPFDGVDYLVDMSALTDATTALHSHWSTVLNGSGATITLNGTPYSVDSTKLSVAKNDFVSHLGTIAGNGSKVKVNGVEYPFDTAKVSDATAELHAVFGGMISGGGEEEDTIAAGLYETGSNYTVLLKSWEDLLAEGTVHVENGVVYTNMDFNTWENTSADALAGDLMLPHDGSIAALGNAAWDDTIYNEEWDEYGAYTGNAAFAGCCNLTSIIIPDGVTTIGTEAFGGCESLTSITIPNSVTSIGDYAFDWCGLADIIIPDSVTSIGEGAFYDCWNLRNVTISTSVMTIGWGAFYNCTSLASITIPDGVTSIGDEAFYNCAALTSVEIPDSVTTIGEYAFAGCTSLASVTFGENSQLTTINYGVFCNCSALTSIEIPASTTTVGDDAFSGTALTSVGPVGSGASVEIPDGVTYIGCGAFSWCSALTSIEIPEGITSIGDSAFYECTSLTSITIPDSVTNIGERAFQGCTSLTSITVPASVTTLDCQVFCNCSALTSIEIPDGVITIGERVFSNCAALTSIEIPASTTTIGDYAFYNCTSLTSITFEGTKAQWNAITKGNYWNYNVPASRVQYVGDTSLPAGGEVDAETGEILDSWEVIINNVDNNTYATKYAVGNYKALDLGSEGVVNMQIAAIDADTMTSGGTAAITWITKELLASTHAMNNTNTNANGWKASGMRAYLQNDVWALIPADVQNAIVEVKKTYYDYTTKSTLISEDTLWIPSRLEVYGSASAAENDGVVYSELFPDQDSRVKTLNGSNYTWWLRTAHSFYNDSFYFASRNNIPDITTANVRGMGVALGFCF